MRNNRWGAKWHNSFEEVGLRALRSEGERLFSSTAIGYANRPSEALLEPKKTKEQCWLMAIHATSIQCRTGGNGEVVDVTAKAQTAVDESGLTIGVLTLFVSGSTGALTTIEFEPGAVSDFQRLFDEIVSPDREYKHHLRWGDDNGHSHVRAALLGPSLGVPFTDGHLTLGTWQQIIFCDFDTRSRDRTIVAHAVGE